MHVHGAATPRTQRILRLSLVATLVYVLVTFVAGLRAHSLALISEAGHNVSDALALLLSFVAVYFQGRPASDAKTFGYQRAGVLAAFLNALTLIVIAVGIAIGTFVVGLVALGGISFKVPFGAIVSLIGPNGAGKTTAFNVITGFTKATDGQVFFRGRDLSFVECSDFSHDGTGWRYLTGEAVSCPFDGVDPAMTIDTFVSRS